MARKPEADDARNVLARVLIARGDAAAGLALLREIPSGSRHFPSAVQTIGQAYLRMYRDEKKKPEAQRNADQLTKSRGLAVENLGKSLELQKKSLAAGEPMPKQIADLQYMLGSLALEGKDDKTAQSLLDPLVNDWERNNKSSKKEMDDDAQRLFVATIRAHVENGESAAAGRLVETLVTNGTDAPNSNAPLAEFALPRAPQGPQHAAVQVAALFSAVLSRPRGQ